MLTDAKRRANNNWDAMKECVENFRESSGTNPKMP